MRLYAILLLISLISFLWITGQRASQDLGLDEGYSLLYTSSSPGLYEHQTLETAVKLGEIPLQPKLSYTHLQRVSERLAESGETHPPFYYWLISSMLSIDYKLWVARSLSGVFSLLTLVLLFRLTQKFYFFSSALLAAIFLLNSSHFIQVSTQARMHSLTLFLTVLALCMMNKIIENKKGPSKTTLFFFGVVLSLGLLNSFLFGHFALAALVLLTCKIPFKKTLFSIIPLALSQAIYLSTTGLTQLRRIPYGEFSFSKLIQGPAAPFYTAPLSILEQITSIPTNLTILNSLQKIHPLMGQALALAFILSLFWVWKKEEKKWLLLITLIPWGSILLFDLLTQSFVSHWGESRAVNFLAPGLCLTLVMVLEKVPKPQIKNSLTALLVLTALIYNHKKLLPSEPGHAPGFQKVSQELIQQYNPEIFLFIKDHKAQNAPKSIEKIYFLKAWAHFPKGQKAHFLRAHEPYSHSSQIKSLGVLSYDHKAEARFFQKSDGLQKVYEVISQGDEAIPVPLRWAIYR